MEKDVMRNISIKKILKSILFILIIMLLTADFYNNTLHIVEPTLFDNYEKDSESIVIGRLLKSKKEGVFSEGGFLGWNHPHDSLLDKNTKVIFNRFSGAGSWGYKTPYQTNKYAYQYDGFEYNHPVGQYEKYYSRSGMQAIVYSFIGELFKIKGYKLIKLCQFLNALFLAVLLSFFLLWVSHFFGTFSTAICFLFILFSHFIILIANNMLYVTGLFFLPMICNLCYLHYRSNKRTFSVNKLFLLTLFTIILKCTVSGFDFIIPTLVMTIVPLIFYSYKDKVGFNVFLRCFMFISVGALSGVLISLLILITQLASYYDSWSEALSYLIRTTEGKTYGNQKDLIYVVGLNEKNSILKLLEVYLNGIAIDLSSFFDLKIRFKSLFSVIFLMSTVVPLTNFKANRNLVGLVIITWISIAGPLLWFIIFKYHTISHLHINQIMWYFPSLLFGIVIVAYVLQKGFHYIALTLLKYLSLDKFTT